MRRLPDWLDAYMQYTANSEPPKLYHTWTAISTVAAALQRKCVLNWGSLRFFPNMYIVLSGPAGRARKGTAMAYGKNLLYQLGIKMSAESSTREALVRDIKEAQMTEIDEETGAMSFHSSLTVYSPELVVFLGYQNQQLMMDLTDWFDCGHGPDGKWTYRTKHQGTDEVVGIWLNLIGATTPDLLRSTLSSDAVGGGLISRMIFVYESDKFQSCPTPFLNPEDEAIGQDLYYDLEQIHLLKGSFKVTKEFISLWIEWYLDNDKNPPFRDHPQLASYCERRAVHLMKLSMILNACHTDSMIIGRPDLERAIDLLKRTEVGMPKTFSGIGNSPHAPVLSKIMTIIGMAERISLKELQRKVYQDADSRVLGVIIQTLKGMGFITISEEAGGTIIKYNKGANKGGVQ